ncbi:DUF1501 domain-containing protein [Asticcacaulis sp. BYS171W]|uniref:DUF1501 domain-containing protein n=1 Tax=Asticcacaulis aquaticus TaxID=2984212 RepID=A0ABT5HWW5_9CAUL|nr:DUF1501 domain-containing protein [Asticcacaulis aquaticus]MDC7684570.1 DUF1501 domain-containing protein [Asticcacaulis aquaticus]
MTVSLDRRQFLRFGAGLAGMTTAGSFGLQLAAAGSAAGQSASDYKAIVCVFLFGGNDANNMVLATDTDSWGRYFSARNQGADPIALMPVGTPATPIGAINPVTGRASALGKPEHWGGVLPIAPKTTQAIPAGTTASNRTFALHPLMAPCKTLFDQGRLAVMANVGTLIQPVTKAQYNARSVSLPANLYSHNDQQSTWQAGAAEGARIGWGGQMGDLLMSMNGTNTIFTAITAGGTAVYLSGRNVVQYPLSTNNSPAIIVNGTASTSLYGSTAAPAALKEIISNTASTSDFANDFGSVVNRSVGAASVVNEVFGRSVVTSVPSPANYTNPATNAVETNSLALQLRTVARMIAAGPSFGLKRQVFMVSLGGFDSHDTQNRDQSNNLAKIAHAFAYFDQTLSNIGGVDMRNSVTTFTASDFSRTFSTNGDGTDHAWGGHHLIMGGAVKGGDMYGQFPTVGMDVNGFSNPGMVGASFIPTTSVDQYAATMGAWFGVGNSDLNTIFPNLRNFSTANLGFV